MKETVNELAIRAKTDARARDNFIQEQEQTILRMASRALGRYITVSDDEWSVSLYAFSKAIDTYVPEKGDFLGFAQVVIRRDLVDAWRRQSKYAPEISTAPYVMEGNAEPEEDPDHVLQAVARESMQAADSGPTLAEEILEANQTLAGFGFSFFDLTECSPKQERTRAACAEVVRWLIKQPDLADGICRNGQLPATRIRRDLGASEKLLEKYRRYLVAAVVILQGDYPGLQEYLRYMRDETPVILPDEQAAAENSAGASPADHTRHLRGNLKRTPPDP